MFAYGLSPCEMNQSYLTLIVGGSLLYSVPTKSALRTTVLRSTVLRTTVLRTTVLRTTVLRTTVLRTTVQLS